MIFNEKIGISEHKLGCFNEQLIFLKRNSDFERKRDSCERQTNFWRVKRGFEQKLGIFQGKFFEYLNENLNQKLRFLMKNPYFERKRDRKEKIVALSENLGLLNQIRLLNKEKSWFWMENRFWREQTFLSKISNFERKQFEYFNEK